MEPARRGLWFRFLRLLFTELWKTVWSKITSAVFVVAAIFYSGLTGKLSTTALRDNLPGALIPFIFAIALLVFILDVRTALLLSGDIKREQTEAKPIKRVSSVLTHFGTPVESWDPPPRIAAFQLKILGIAISFAVIPTLLSYGGWRLATTQVPPAADARPRFAPEIPQTTPNKTSEARPRQARKVFSNSESTEARTATDQVEDINPQFRESITPQIKAATELLGMSQDQLRKYVSDKVQKLKIFDAGWQVPRDKMEIEGPGIDDPNGVKKLADAVGKRDQFIKAAQAKYEKQFQENFPDLEVIADELVQRCQQKGISSKVEDQFNPSRPSPFPPPYDLGVSGTRAASYLEALTRKCLP